MSKRFFLYFMMTLESIFSPFRSKFNSIYRRFFELPLTLSRKISAKFSNLISKKETSVKDYVKANKHYISKKFLLVSVIFLFVGIFLGYQFLKEKGFIYSNFYKTDNITYSGKVRIYDNKKDKNLIYIGNLEKGMFSEYGELYYKDPKKVLQYKGQFKNNEFSDFGILYDKNHNTIYKGTFSNGVFDGSGQEFFSNGKLKYEGDFKKGNYDGIGKKFDSDGFIAAEGTFSKGLLTGEGKIYYPNNILKYEGTFIKDLFDGSGTLYANNHVLIYKGDFKSGLYDGKGELFNADSVKLYEGDFKKGVYEGTGTLFNTDGNTLFTGKFKDGKPIDGTIQADAEEKFTFTGTGVIYSSSNQNAKKYEGELKDNKFEGKGILYFEDEKNTIKYEGDFKNNVFDGIGTLYDISKAIIYKGYFKEGTPAVEEFIGKSDSELKSILGQPDNVISQPNENYAFTYDKLNLKFVLNKDNDLRILKIKSVIVSSVIDIFHISINMKKPDIIKVLGEPIQENTVIDDLTKTKTINLIYYIDNYSLTLSFAEASPNIISEEVSIHSYDTSK